MPFSKASMNYTYRGFLRGTKAPANIGQRQSLIKLKKRGENQKKKRKKRKKKRKKNLIKSKKRWIRDSRASFLQSEHTTSTCASETPELLFFEASTQDFTTSPLFLLLEVFFFFFFPQKRKKNSLPVRVIASELLILNVCPTGKHTNHNISSSMR